MCFVAIVNGQVCRPASFNVVIAHLFRNRKRDHAFEHSKIPIQKKMISPFSPLPKRSAIARSYALPTLKSSIQNHMGKSTHVAKYHGLEPTRVPD